MQQPGSESQHTPQSGAQDSTLFSFRSAYSRFSLVLLAIALITLLPHYGKILNPSTAVSTQMIVHGCRVFVLVYFVHCAILVWLPQGRLHCIKNLAIRVLHWQRYASIAGLHLLLDAMRGFDPNWHELYLYSRISLIWGIYHTLASFNPFLCLGGLNQKESTGS